jgi:hypothetical protein
MSTGTLVKVEQWRTDYDRIWQEVVRLWHKRHLLKEIMEIYAKNVGPRVEDHTVVNWLVDNYAKTIAFGIRGQADLSGDVVSMATLLKDLKAHASLLTAALRISWLREDEGMPKPLTLDPLSL